MSQKKVLLVDDEEVVLNALRLIIEDFGHEVETYTDPTLAEQRAVEQEFDLIVTDLRMPKLNGADLTASVRRRYPDARILVITGYPDDELAVKALQEGAIALLKKPFEVARIIEYLNEPVSVEDGGS